MVRKAEGKKKKKNERGPGRPAFGRGEKPLEYPFPASRKQGPGRDRDSGSNSITKVRFCLSHGNGNGNGSETDRPGGAGEEGIFEGVLGTFPLLGKSKGNERRFSPTSSSPLAYQWQSVSVTQSPAAAGFV